MNIRRCTFFTAFAAAAAISLAAAQAPQSGVASETSDSSVKRPASITIDFPGGTATEYVDALRKAAKDVNVALVADVSSVRVPPVSLKNVDPIAAAEILRSVPEEQGGRFVQFELRYEKARSADQSGLITVGAKISNKQHPGGDAVISRVFAVSNLLMNDIKPADLLTSVQTALEMNQNPAMPAQIRFHEATGLLIVRGTGEQVETVTAVVEQLRQQPKSAANADETIFRLQRDSALAEKQAAAEKSKAVAAANDAARWETQNQMLQQEVARLRDMLSLREKEISELSVRLKIMEVELDRVRQSNSGKPQ
jgi:hypothetical protein